MLYEYVVDKKNAAANLLRYLTADKAQLCSSVCTRTSNTLPKSKTQKDRKEKIVSPLYFHLNSDSHATTMFKQLILLRFSTFLQDQKNHHFLSPASPLRAFDCRCRFCNENMYKLCALLPCFQHSTKSANKNNLKLASNVRRGQNSSKKIRKQSQPVILHPRSQTNDRSFLNLSDASAFNPAVHTTFHYSAI